MITDPDPVANPGLAVDGRPIPETTARCAEALTLCALAR
jgi:hypothetical protein